MDDGEYARVSPDGKKIAFLRGEYPRREIWSMNADGSRCEREWKETVYICWSSGVSPDSHALAYVRG